MRSTEPSDNTFILALPMRDGKAYVPLSEIRIDRALNRGNVSDTYLGHHMGLDFPVILRVMKSEVHKVIGEKGVSDLAKAGRQYARVRHPNLVAVIDGGLYQGRPFVVQEYMCGIPLDERMKERPLSEEEALRLMVPVADGLASLWKNDVVHRGVSPHRLLIDERGEPRLDIVVLPRIPLDPVLIEAHAPFMAGYWPPEELKQSRDIDARSDMYSFGASLYYALTGVSPHGKGSRTELMARTLTETPMDLREHASGISAPIAEFVKRCLQSNPRDRFQSTAEFTNALQTMRVELCCKETLRPSTFGPMTLISDSAGTPATPLQVGDIVGQCQLEHVVGTGAFGVVFKARHKLLDIPVAIKFLPTQIAEKNPDYVSLFLREARTAIRIRDKHVIGLYEAGNQNGQYYLTMEFAPNGSLLDRFRKSNGPLPEAEVLKIIKEVALGLCAAEEINIIHRDIKPANLMYGTNHEIKIADLGLAKRLPNPSQNADESSPSIRAEQLTMLRGESAIQGTPDYMAPEMALTPHNVDIRADMYSLGVTAYQMLAGRLPFEGSAPFQVIMKHVSEPIKPLREANPNVSTKIDELVMRLVEKKPENRYPTARALSAALNSF